MKLPLKEYGIPGFTVFFRTSVQQEWWLFSNFHTPPFFGIIKHCKFVLPINSSDL